MKSNKSVWSFIVVLSAIVLLVAACKKEDDDDGHHAATASVSISSPADDAMYNVNDTVHINAALLADETLHGYDVYIRRKADNSTVFTADAHVHNKSITVDTFWVNTLSGDTTDMELEITTAIDHDGNSIGKKVGFKCLP